MPFPKNYLLGIDIQQRDFEDYGRPSYLRGDWQDHGWWYYYLYAALIKIPLGTWALGVLTLILLGCGVYTLRWREIFFLATPPLVIFVVCSSKTGFSEHFRYVLPCFPFAFIWLSGVANQGKIAEIKKTFACETNDAKVDAKSTQLPLRLASCLVGFAVMWSVTSSCWIYPHSLSYFNESIGGPLHGWMHLAGSSADWGQDEYYAKKAKEGCSGSINVLSSDDTVLDRFYDQEGRYASKWKATWQAGVPVCYTHRKLDISTSN